MSRIPVPLATVKAILIAAALSFSTGDGLPVVVVSLLFKLAHFREQPAGQTGPPEHDGGFTEA
jgi:hypothetical protein